MPLRRQNLFCVLSLCALVSACEPDVSIELQAQTPNLHVKAEVRSIEFDFDDDKATYRASTTITNTSKEPRNYSNMWLWLESGTTLSARAYLDSLASHQIDTGPVELGPNESLDLEIYWVFPSSEFEDSSDVPFDLVLRTEVVIYFYGFEIERITGIHEEEIEELGCVYSADSHSIESALTIVSSIDANYDRRDIRAKIEMHGESYFVDRAGIARQADDYFRLDKAQFIAAIAQVGSCE